MEVKYCLVGKVPTVDSGPTAIIGLLPQTHYFIKTFITAKWSISKIYDLCNYSKKHFHLKLFMIEQFKVAISYSTEILRMP